MQDKTILQVIPNLHIGGAEQTVLEITRAIVEAGGRALIASAYNGSAYNADDKNKNSVPSLAPAIIAAGGEIITLPVASKNPFIMFANIKRLAIIIRRYRVDIIHARSRAPAWSAYAAARKTGIAYLSTYHAKVHAHPALKRFYNSGLVRGQLVIANSQFTAAQIMRFHKVPLSHIRVIPRGCDIEALAPTTPAKTSRQAMRAKWNVSADDFVILCPARLTRWKGQHIAVAAIAEALKTQDKKNIKLVCVGGIETHNDYIQTLSDLATRLGVAQNVILAGVERDMRSVYGASDVVVAPSIEAEPFGRIIIEAQAAGLAVIASDAGGFRETVADHAGWLVPPDDVAALGQCFARAIMTPPKDLAAMGAIGCAYVASRYSDALMCSRTLDVYRELA
ncbi:MAG: glycosyltransferase family 4 protein [Alphaproteobacteria bacterium]|nr:glycosyltransferase family 4 protein [Alphaproteobacteria bacterium]